MSPARACDLDAAGLVKVDDHTWLVPVLDPTQRTSRSMRADAGSIDLKQEGDAVPRDRLYRSRTDRVLAGVAGGMAEWLDQDPSIVRLVWAVLVVFGGAGLILYIIAAFVIPEEPLEAEGPMPVGGVSGTSSMDPGADPRAARRGAHRARYGPSSGGIVIGLILILAGGWFLLRDVFPWIDDSVLGPVILVAAGILLIAAALRRPNPPAA
jgi:phage shock protein PspC (stress-responsive transcriptional regulator)